MTIKKLKEMIASLPDDARIYLDDGTSLFEGNSEVVVLASSDNKVILQTKADIDVGEELDARLKAYEEDWDEADAFYDLSEHGFNEEDFDYNPDMYAWVKEFSKRTAWC